MAEEEDDELDMLLASYDEQAAREVQALEAAATKAKQPRKAKDRERQGREQALETPLSEQSKGFQMLAKMGYQRGRGLGRCQQGRAEPVPVHIRSARAGLGVDEAARTAKRAAEAAEEQRAVKRLQQAQASQATFRDVQAGTYQLRKLEASIAAAESACQSLDEAAGITDNPLLAAPEGGDGGGEGQEQGSGGGEGAAAKPGTSSAGRGLGADAVSEEAGLPPPCSRRQVLEPGQQQQQAGSSRRQQPRQQGEGQPAAWGTAAAAGAPALDLRSQTAAAQARLDALLAYLRARHRWCVWCGCGYDSAEDLAAHCPGAQEQDHEG